MMSRPAEGTFEAAARSLHVTPSAVSQRIKTLETTLGRVLVTRSKPIQPTASGQTLLRVARQVQALMTEAGDAFEADPTTAAAVISVAVNADSLATWFLPALAAVGSSFRFDLRRVDQDQTASLLRDGTVMAAVTTQREPVPGCTVERLGRMRYRPRASPSFVATWFPQGVTVAALAQAPLVVFDREDRLQDRYLRRRSRRRIEPPHFVPAIGPVRPSHRPGLGHGLRSSVSRQEIRRARSRRPDRRGLVLATVALAHGGPRPRHGGRQTGGGRMAAMTSDSRASA